MASQHRLGKIASLASCIRYRDAVIFQSPCLVGALIFLPSLSLDTAARTLVLAAGSFMLMAYIFAFNDWTDVVLDTENTQKGRRSFLKLGVTGREMLLLAVVLAVAGVLSIAAISVGHALVALLIVVFGLAYSFPVRGLKVKGIPVLSSGLHFVGTLATFLLGSTTFWPLETRSLLVGSYFGVLIVAGHLVQEVQDYADDRLAGMRTNAVQFGQEPVFVLACAVFGLSFLYLIWLSQARLITGLAQFTVLLYPVFAVWAIQASRAGLAKDHVRRLRSGYRILFALVVVVMLAGALGEKAARL